MEICTLTRKTALPPALLPGLFSLPRPASSWALHWSKPTLSLQNLMHFRYDASTLGRFMKPDNVTGSPLNPQNWNLYSYVRGNPVNMNDPTGHQGEDSAKIPQSGGDSQASQQAQQQIKEEQTGNKDTENKPPETAKDEAGKVQTDNQETKQEQVSDATQTSIAGGTGRKGGQGKGERKRTAKPEKPRKHAKFDPKTGRWWVQDSDGKWKPKPKGWDPDTAAKYTIIGIEVGLTVYITYRVIRMIPSLYPPLWGTIPLNAAIP